jgi:phosphate transport system protein
MTINPRETLDSRIKELYGDILTLGSMVEQATLNAVDALKNRDLKKARQTYAGDEAINAKRSDIENDVMVLIATQQPMARDVRVLASVFEVANELERMGDYAKGVARIHILSAEHPPIKPITTIPKMAEIVTDMLRRALDAFVNSDDEVARQIPKEDDEVDKLYQQIINEIIAIMIEDSGAINSANNLIWAGHNLERMADRVTNICERTVYVATGKMEEIKPSDDESSAF